MRFMRIGRIFKGAVLLVAGYLFFQTLDLLINGHNGSSERHNGSSERHNDVKVPDAGEDVLKHHPVTRNYRKLSRDSNITADYNNCEVIQVAVVVASANQVHPFIQMLKTLLHARQDNVSLHVLCDKASRIILRRLFDTWELPGFTAEFYLSADIKLMMTDLQTTRLQLQIHRVLPDTVDKVLVVDCRMRFLRNPRLLWQHIDKFSENQVLGMTSVSTKNQPRYFPNLLLLRLDRLRKTDPFEGHLDDITGSWASLNAWFTKHQMIVYNLPCDWLIRLEPRSNVESCLRGGSPKGLWWGNGADRRFTKNEPTERAKLHVTSLIEADGELLRGFNSRCVDVIISPMKSSKNCEEFRHAASLKRRTHLFFTGQYGKLSSGERYDVSLVTQLTLDRFGVLERMISQWAGPLHAVFHVTEKEAQRLPEMAVKSAALKTRTNVAFHVVYKRGIFNPINYLRNVGIGQVETPYTLFVDVDLVPNVGLYNEIKRLIPREMNTPATTLVVPSFEAFMELSVFPDKKEELLKLIENKMVEGYRMSRGWNLGHKPTNYPAWIRATEPYLAQFRDAFEPYVVMKTLKQPQFEEQLMERMGDKISYGRRLYAMGFQFKVMPEHYVIHLPHAVSSGTNLWKSYPGYARCGGIQFEEFRREMKRKYPDQKY